MKPIRCKICSQLGHYEFECPFKNFFSLKINYEFSGSSPPEIFVGRHNYPYVYAGILAPNEYGETEKYSMPEIWYKNNFDLKKIVEFRMKMIYSRFIVNVKNKDNKKIEALQELALASKHVDASFELEKRPKIKVFRNSYWPIIGNPSPLKKVVLESNPKIDRKVEKISEDCDIKANKAVMELYRGNVEVSHIIRILSAGMLGLKFQRKLVPTRWAVTAVDDIISRNLIEKIKQYKLIDEFLVFNEEYLGNHYEILLIPKPWSFEVIEAKMPGCACNRGEKMFIACDYENYYGRKEYASNVTGAYYANRLAVAEYLARKKRQASCIVLREINPSYNIPCGVGILREATRNALSKEPERFSSLEEAINSIKKRLRVPIEELVKRSKIVKEIKTQKNLLKFLKS
jgi:hypothetical protein